MYTVYPWIHQYNNNKTREGQLESCMFPDRNPNNLPADSQFSMAAGDFLEIYTEPGNHLLVWWKKFGRDQCTVMWVKFVGVEGLGLGLYFLTNAYRYVSWFIAFICPLVGVQAMHLLLFPWKELRSYRWEECNNMATWVIICFGLCSVKLQMH